MKRERIKRMEAVLLGGNIKPMRGSNGRNMSSE